MTFSYYAGVAIVPTLARIVLCAVFITAGYNKIKATDFSAEETAKLQTMKVNVVTASATTMPVIVTSTAPAVDTTPPAVPGSSRALALYKLAIMLDKEGWPQPVAQAWLAALTELVGGCMLVIGLFSRIWALGLSVVMGVAFYLTSLPPLLGVNWVLTQMGPMEMSTMSLQLALFVLAFGVLLTGPGPLSLDRILFGGPPEPVEVEVEEIKTRTRPM